MSRVFSIRTLQTPNSQNPRSRLGFLPSGWFVSIYVCVSVYRIARDWRPLPGSVTKRWDFVLFPFVTLLVFSFLVFFLRSNLMLEAEFHWMFPQQTANEDTKSISWKKQKKLLQAIFKSWFFQTIFNFSLYSWFANGRIILFSPNIVAVVVVVIIDSLLDDFYCSFGLAETFPFRIRLERQSCVLVLFL